MIKVAPSILSADFAFMGETVKKLEGWGADWVHFDVMDGHFVPEITFGAKMCKALRPLTPLPLDVHLMVDHPGDWIEAFADAGADWLTVHVEADRHLNRTLQRIHAAGMKAGVVLNPATSPETVDYVLEDCDLVLLMSVNPGAGGQKFIPSVLRKIETVRRTIDERNLPTLIEIDGGVNPETAKQCIAAGADVLVAGNSVFSAPDPVQRIREIRG